jgi:hypothetical protein
VAAVDPLPEERRGSTGGVVEGRGGVPRGAVRGVERGARGSAHPPLVERIADLDVVAHPRHLKHLPGEAVGRCYQL